MDQDLDLAAIIDGVIERGRNETGPRVGEYLPVLRLEPHSRGCQTDGAACDPRLYRNAPKRGIWVLPAQRM